MKQKTKQIKKVTRQNFDEIYKRYYKPVYEFTLKRVTDTAVAEDLTSMVFEKIMKSFDKFQWQGITISAWIFKIARNNIIDYYRKSNKYKKNIPIEDVVFYLESDEKDAISTLIADEDNVALYNAIREFEEKDQYLIYYKYFEEKSNKEIAKIMNMTQSNIATRLHRIRKRIKDLLLTK